MTASPEIIFADNIPAGIAAVLRKLTAKWQWIIPSWVHVMHVSVADDAEAFASMTTAVEYRTAHMNLASNWLTLPLRERERCFVHELSHLVTAPLVDFYIGLLTDEKLKEQHRVHYEGVTCDLERAFTEARKTGKRKGSMR